jgi:hypothetical protein
MKNGPRNVANVGEEGDGRKRDGVVVFPSAIS